MSWLINFTYDAEHEVVIATFSDVVIKNADDVLRWKKEATTYFRQFGRLVDLLVDLNGLTVKPSAAQLYNEARAEVNGQFVRRSYRFNGDVQTRTATHIGAVLAKTGGELFDTQEQAWDAFMAARVSDQQHESERPKSMREPRSAQGDRKSQRPPRV